MVGVFGCEFVGEFVFGFGVGKDCVYLFGGVVDDCLGGCGVDIYF